ncbi:MAG: metallophosphoesterase [Gemmataceae bacterium]
MSKLTRRGFLGRALLGLGGLGASAFVYAHWIEPYWVSIVRRDMPIANLPSFWNGKVLAQVSDLHFGPANNDEYLRNAIQSATTEFGADLLAITGDFMTCVEAEQVDRTARGFEGITLPPQGAVAILGNHDYGNTYRRPFVADRLSRLLADVGIPMLRNSSRSIRGLRIVGVDDYWGPNFDIAAAMASGDPNEPTIALCHNPDGADKPGWGNYQGWILSGHTHGGQCKVPGCAPPVMYVENRRYSQGAFDLGDGRWLYVNPGLGYSHRLRFSVRPEITLFTLRTA